MLTEAVILIKLVEVILVTVDGLLFHQFFWCGAMHTEAVVLVKLVEVILVDSNVICPAARGHAAGCGGGVSEKLWFGWGGEIADSLVFRVG